MESQLLVESLPLLGVCNLCLNFCAVKSMLARHRIDDNNCEREENYSEMLNKCFSIDMALLDLGDTKRLVCDGCIDKLRDSVQFKKQVEASLQTLETAAKSENVENEAVKSELPEDSMTESAHHTDFDDEDDLFLNEISLKKEPKEEVRTPRKKIITIKVTDSRKSVVSKRQQLKFEGMLDTGLKNTSTKQRNIEIQKMLDSGLFPFKMQKGHYICIMCKEKSINLDDIRNHIKEHHISNINLAFKKMSYSSSHRFYRYENFLRCKLCTMEIQNYEELKQHLQYCRRLKNGSWNTLPFKLEKDQLDCPVCKKTFLNFVSLNTHMNTHYPNFICENCGKAFASKARLRGHMRTHEIGNFPCKYCNAVFDRVTKRENHVSKDHKAGIRYACKRCNITLPSFYARQKHLAEIHNEELKRYKCKACSQSYITPGHLSSHVRRDHLNERNHKCEKCDLAFYTKNALKMHMIKHDGERIHTCSVCQKSYQRKKTLREHLRIHNNDKRFTCPVCGRAFTQKCTLKGHLKVHERKVEVDETIPLNLNI